MYSFILSIPKINDAAVMEACMHTFLPLLEPLRKGDLEGARAKLREMPEAMRKNLLGDGA